MTRGNLDYSARREAVTGEGYDADTPLAGFYRMKLRSDGFPVGIRIWFGAPLDPVTGEELDRSHRWQAHANGQYIDLARVWPRCGRELIDAKEYAYLTAQQRWGQQHAPESPQADPTRAVDLLTAPIPI